MDLVKLKLQCEYLQKELEKYRGLTQKTNELERFVILAIIGLVGGLGYFAYLIFAPFVVFSVTHILAALAIIAGGTFLYKKHKIDQARHQADTKFQKIFLTFGCYLSDTDSTASGLGLHQYSNGLFFGRYQTLDPIELARATSLDSFTNEEYLQKVN